MYEEGSETLNSMVVLAVFLGVAFLVVAVAPIENANSKEFKPLEVFKTKESGPAVVVMGEEVTWELHFTVVNNLDVIPGEDLPDETEDEPNVYFVYTSTRGENAPGSEVQVLNTNTIINVVVSDVLPAEFTAVHYTKSQGIVSMSTNSDGSTQILWNVGDLAPRAQADMKMTATVSKLGFARPATYVLNSGASATGLLLGTKQMVSDGPTNSILVTVIDGVPNEAPFAEAGIDQMNFKGNPILLDGSRSFDVDGTVVGYQWFLKDKKLGSAQTYLSYFDPGVYEVTLVVTDNRGATDSDTVTVTVYEEGAKVPGGQMHGTVRDATTGRGFDPYIQVSNDDFAISTWTDMGGNYRIIGIPAGEYQVFCWSEGYRDHIGEVTITESGDVLYDINLIRVQ